MTVKIQTENGQIELSNEVIATVVGGAATDNYGVFAANPNIVSKLYFTCSCTFLQIAEIFVP